MVVKLLTEYHLKFLSLKGGCTGSYEYTLVIMPHCWKSHVAAQIKNDHNFTLTMLFIWTCDNDNVCSIILLIWTDLISAAFMGLSFMS